MKTEIIQNIEEFQKLKQEWEDLENLEKETTIFQTFLYNYTWWDTVKNLEKYKLSIVVVREDNGNLIGIAPFVIEEEKKLFFKLKILKFMAWGDYLGIIIKKENTNVSKILSKIFETIESLKVDKIFFTNIDIQSSLGKYLQKHQKYNYLLEFQVECPRVKFSNYNNFEEFKLKFLSTSIKKQKNKMQKEIGYVFKVENNKDNDSFLDIEKIHKELKEFLNTRNNNNKRRSSYENIERREFLLQYYKKSDKILNFFLKKENDIIIYDSSYLMHNRIFSWNMAHSCKYNNYNPGRVINYEIMNWGFNEEKKEYIFDFGCGGYPWKFQWTDDFTSVYKLEYYISKNRKIKLIEKLKLIKRGMECFINILRD